MIYMIPYHGRPFHGRRFHLFLFFSWASIPWAPFPSIFVFSLPGEVFLERKKGWVLVGESSESNCFWGAKGQALRCIISGNSRQFGRRFHLFLFFPAGRGVFGAPKGGGWVWERAV